MKLKRVIAACFVLSAMAALPAPAFAGGQDYHSFKACFNSNGQAARCL